MTSSVMTSAAVPPSATRSDRVVVVGGGVIGASCAYFLRQAGKAVTLIDSGQFGKGCSHGNCGYVCPSHVLPLAGPGAFRTALKTLFRKNSPLKVRWRLDPALWSWFWQFSRRCNQRDALAAGRAIQQLLASSRALLRGTLPVHADGRGVGPCRAAVRVPDAICHGSLRPNRSTAAKRVLVSPRRDWRGRALGIRARTQAVRRRAWRYATDGQLRPDKLMSAWRRTLESIGVEIREQCALRDSGD